MKKSFGIILSSVLFLLFSCGIEKRGEKASTPEVDSGLRVSLIEIQQNSRLIITDTISPTITFDIKLSQLTLDNKEAEAKIDSALAENLFGFRTTLIDAASRFIDERELAHSDYRDIYINAKEGDIPPFMMDEYYIISGTADVGYKGCINYFVHWEEYTGGAHPSTVCHFHNYDPVSGNEITLNDVLKEGYEERLLTMLTDKLLQYAGAANIDELHEIGYLTFGDDMYITRNVMFGKEGISFLYNRYEIAPYAMGETTLLLTYNELKDLLK